MPLPPDESWNFAGSIGRMKTEKGTDIKTVSSHVTGHGLMETGNSTDVRRSQ
jgi:hypothetical protein